MEAPLGGLVARPIALRAGEELMREGGLSDDMYLLRAGALEVERVTPDGHRFVLARIGPGRLVGELSLLSGRPHSATVRAAEDCELLAISRESYAQLAKQLSTPLESLLLDIARNLGDALVRSTEDTVDALRRELELSRARAALGSFIVHLLLGFAAYAAIMRYLAANQVPLANATVITGPLMLGMTAISISFARRSGLPSRIFGLTWADAGRHARQAALWTLPVLLALVGLKWALVHLSPALAGEPVIPLLHRPFRPGPALGYLVYAALVPLQEFLARGAIQGPLTEMLTGSPRRRTFWAVLVSNTLFAITHLHLTFTYSGAAFVGGLLWGWIYARQRSLVGPVVSHVLIGVFTLYVLGFADILKGIS